MKFNEYIENLNEEIKEYYNIISPVFPKFLIPFIESKTLMRLKDISYFCGATHASDKVYNFKYDISRLDHSISCALHVWNHTFDDIATLRALFHDATTPALSHVIDYLNKDYLKQESTELNLEEYIKKNDIELYNYFKLVGINIKDISNFKESSIVDFDRPKLCADRLDFIFLNNLAWSKLINLNDIKKMYKHLIVKTNEEGKEEFAFDDINIADYVVELNDIINTMTRQNDDYEEMNVLSMIIKRLIYINKISYNDLYILNDNDIFKIIEDNIKDNYINKYYKIYKTMEKDERITTKELKNRKLNPLVLNIRYTNYL